MDYHHSSYSCFSFVFFSLLIQQKNLKNCPTICRSLAKGDWAKASENAVLVDTKIDLGKQGQQDLSDAT